jgi:hypothetical protein
LYGENLLVLGGELHRSYSEPASDIWAEVYHHTYLLFFQWIPLLFGCISNWRQNIFSVDERFCYKAFCLCVYVYMCVSFCLLNTSVLLKHWNGSSIF